MSTGTININPDLLKTIRKIAKRENTSENNVINDLIAKGIEKSEPKIPEHLITNKDTYNPNPERVMKMAGIIKGCKPFNAVELIRDMRKGE
jgi:hypothetical protein